MSAAYVTIQTIRHRILKVGQDGPSLVIRRCYNPDDPTQDTESEQTEPRAPAGRPCYNPDDPTQDTESSATWKLALTR